MVVVFFVFFSNFTHRAETFVVKLAQSFAYNSLVVPVMSSHWAGAVPPMESTPSESQTSSARGKVFICKCIQELTHSYFYSVSKIQSECLYLSHIGKLYNVEEK